MSVICELVLAPLNNIGVYLTFKFLLWKITNLNQLKIACSLLKA